MFSHSNIGTRTAQAIVAIGGSTAEAYFVSSAVTHGDCSEGQLPAARVEFTKPGTCGPYQTFVTAAANGSNEPFLLIFYTVVNVRKADKRASKLGLNFKNWG
jgi:hypothetical protein